MRWLAVCLCVGYTSMTTVTGSSPHLNAGASNASFFSMPVQFSMAAPLTHASSPLSKQATSAESSDWSPLFASRRGYYGPPRPHRKKYRPSYEEYMQMRALRRHPLPREPYRRIYPKYPPSLQPYSHNYRFQHSRPAHHRIPEEHRPQNSHYVEYPPYTSKYQPTEGAHFPPSPIHHQQHPHHAPYHQAQTQQYQPHNDQYVGEYSQFSPQYPGEVQQHQPHNDQSPVREYSQFAPQFQNNVQNSNHNNPQTPNIEYQQHPSQYTPNEQSYPPKHQAHNSEYQQSPSDYQSDGSFAQDPPPNYHNLPEPHIPPYHSSEYTDNSVYGSQQPSHMESAHSSQTYQSDPPPPDYNPEMTKELLELNQEIGLMHQSGNSQKSILHLLVPLLMLGVSIPALGYMYSHMIRRRSFQEWPSEDVLNEYIQILQRGIQCYQKLGQCRDKS